MKSKHLLLTLLLALFVPWAAMAQNLCDPADMCEISYTLTDAYGDGWDYGAYLNVVDATSNTTLAQWRLNSGASSSGTLAVCNGRAINFVWVPASGSYVYNYECGFTVTDPNGTVIVSHTGSSSDSSVAPTEGIVATYTVVCPSCPLPTLSQNVTVGSTTATLTWVENGEADAWVLQYGTNSDFTAGTFVEVSSGFTVEGTTITANINGLTAEQTYYARVRAACNTETEWSITASFTPTAAITATIYQNATDHCDYVPVYGYYADNRQQSEFIIPASQLSGLADGTIKAMTFYASYNFNSTASFQVYLKEVEDETISQSTFYGTEGATTVYTGKVSISSTNGMTITFTNNYAYNGGNLLVGFYLPSGGNCSSSGDYFIGKTVNGASHSSTYGNSPTQRNFIPTTTFLYLPSPTPKPLNLHVVNGSLSSTGATLAWTAPSTSTPTSYEYRYKTDASAWSAWESTTELSVALNLSSSTHHTFQVKAIYDGVGESAAVETDFTTLDDCAFPTNLVATTTPGQGTKATLTWVKGYDETAWVLEYATNNTFTEGLVEVTDGFTVEGNNVTANLIGLTAEQTYYARVKANCDGLTSSWAYFEAFTPTNYVDYTFNEDATSNSSYSYIPFRGSYVAYQTNSQFIIPQTSLGDLAGGTVKKLTFYSTSTYANVAWGDASFKVYVAEVDNTTFASKPTSLDWSAMEEVYSGSLSVVNSQMVIELDQEFTYSGTKNLMIGFEKTAVGTNATVAWIYKSASNTCAYSYNSFSATGALSYDRSGYLPKMTFNYRPTSTPRPIITEPVATTDVTATIAWTKPSDNVTGYKYQYKLASATEWPTSWTELNDANAVSVTVPNLTPNTSYDFQMKAVYAEGESVASSTSFATTCPAATAVPYTYGFETAPEFNCWEVTSSVSNGVKRTNSYAHVGNYSLVFYGTQLNEIEMPLFNQPTNTLRLEYWVRPEGYQDSRSGSFAIGYYNANDEFVALKTYEFNTTTGQYDDWESTVYIKQSIDFDVDADNDGTPDVPADAHIVFRQLNTTSNYYWMVDDVKVKVIPTCDDVENPVCTAQTAHTATLSWTLLDNTQTAWQVAYSTEANFTPNDVTPVDVNSNPCTIEELLANTTYYAYIRSNCGSGIYGDWSETYATFTTAIGNPAPTAFHTTDIQQTQVGFEWTNGGGDYEESWMIYLWNESIDINNIADDDLDPSGFRSAGSHPTAITNLTPGTTYYAWVRSNCGSDGMSAWTALEGNSFTTVPTCPIPENLAVTPGSETTEGATITWDGTNDSFVVELGTYDFNATPSYVTILEEDLEGGSMPTGWTHIGNGNVEYYSYNSHSTSHCIKFSDAKVDNVLVLPALSTKTNLLTISYWSKAEGSSSGEFDMGYVTDPTDASTFHAIHTNKYSEDGNSYTEVSNISMADAPANARVAFRHRSGAPNWYWFLDDITIKGAEYPVVWAQDGTAPNVDDHGTYTFEGLDDLTPYKARVKGICGGSDQSPYSNVVDFTTTEACPAPTDFVLGEVTSSTAAFSWTQTGDVTEWHVWVKESTDPEYPSVYITANNTPSLSITVDLTANTTYDVKIAPACDHDKYLEVSEAFTTLCDPETVTVTEPFTEDFDDWTTGNYDHNSQNGVYPDCWYSDSEGTIYPHIINSGTYAYKHSGSYTMYFMGQASTSSYLALPVFTNDLSTLMVSFWMETENENTGSSTYDYGTLSLGYITDADVNYNTYQVIETYANHKGTMVQRHTFLGDHTIPSNATRLVFRWQYGGTSWYGACIDDVRVAIAETFTKDITGYGNNEGGYVLLASPLADDVNPTDVTNMIADPVEDYDLYYFNQAQADEWRNYKAAAFNLENGKGYLYANKNDVTLTFRGARYTGDGVVNLTYNTDALEFPGLNLVGNPFVTAATPNKPYYRLNSDGATVNAEAYTESTAVNQMEGIFVMASEAGQNVTFTPTTGVGANSSQLNLNLSKDNRMVDNAIVRFDGGSTLQKFSFREGSTKVYITEEGKDYAVVNVGQVGEIPVSFKAEKNGSYTLSFTSQEVTFSYLHLIDNMTGEDVNLLVNPSYSFDARTTDYESRFRLVFATGSSATGDNFSFINTNGNLCIFGIEGEATVQVIDILGHVLSSETFSDSYEKKINGAPGVYMIRLVNGNDVKVQKVVVR